MELRELVLRMSESKCFLNSDSDLTRQVDWLVDYARRHQETIDILQEISNRAAASGGPSTAPARGPSTPSTCGSSNEEDVSQFL